MAVHLGRRTVPEACAKPRTRLDGRVDIGFGCVGVPEGTWPAAPYRSIRPPGSGTLPGRPQPLRQPMNTNITELDSPDSYIGAHMR